MAAKYNQANSSAQPKIVLLAAFMAVLLSIAADAEQAVNKIVLHALFQGKAIAIIDGERHVLVAGKPGPDGVSLLSVNTENETVEILVNGTRQTLHLGSISLAPVKTEDNAEKTTTLWADPDGHFYTIGTINGVAVRFLVDTGATSIAMNSKIAERVGIDYKSGKRGYASTAGGYTPMYEVDIKKIKIGDIEQKYVKGGVIEGSHPTDVLLGMTFLNGVEMRRDGNRMDLIYRGQQ